jgi:hypothetical protein
LSPNIRVVKFRTLRWLGHGTYKEEKRNICRVFGRGTSGKETMKKT